MTGWKADDEVITNYKSLKSAQNEAFDEGRGFERLKALIVLETLIDSCDAPEICDSCKGVKLSIESIKAIPLGDYQAWETGE